MTPYAQTKDTGTATGCLSCGATDHLNGRKYCSVSCRQRLQRNLNQRTGLLKALNARYATFYFTGALIILDVIVFDSDRIFSYIHSRSKKGKPADDFIRMANRLGRDWWDERDRTRRRYLATRRLLEMATSSGGTTTSVAPKAFKNPVLKKEFLVRLDLTREDLVSPDVLLKIKSAFRRQAMIAHPDRGGTTRFFRQIHEAYNQLTAWADNPVFSRRQGFPDKWFYNGTTNRWVQPTPTE
jgi:hypothetical protein